MQQADEEEQEVVRLKIETGIGAYNETQSPTWSIWNSKPHLEHRLSLLITFFCSWFVFFFFYKLIICLSFRFVCSIMKTYFAVYIMFLIIVLLDLRGGGEWYSLSLYKLKESRFASYLFTNRWWCSFDSAR